MSSAELKISLFRELDKLNQQELREIYQLFKEWLQKSNDQTDKSGQRVIGSLKGTLKFMADDFDAPLDDFKDYM